jgi:hypothetical protein
MRPLLIGLAICSASGLLFFAACSLDPTSAATGTSGSTGGAPNCEGAYIVYNSDGGNDCDICLHDNCCAEIAHCRDKSCIDCVNHLVPSCGHDPRVVNNCLYRYCQPTCSPGWPPTAVGATGGV